MSNSSNVDGVRALYEAFAARDADRARALLAPDVEWIQCAGFPGGDHRHGVDEVLDKVFGGLRTEWRDFAAPIDEIIDGGSTIVVLGRYSGTHATTGLSMTSVFAHVYDLADGKIIRFRQISDTAEMVRAMAP